MNNKYNLESLNRAYEELDTYINEFHLLKNLPKHDPERLNRACEELDIAREKYINKFHPEGLPKHDPESLNRACEELDIAIEKNHSEKNIRFRSRTSKKVVEEW